MRVVVSSYVQLIINDALFQLMVAVGMGPVLALKYFRYTYRSSAINILQQAERSGGPVYSIKDVEPQIKSSKDVVPLSITQIKSRNPVYEPLLSDSPTATRRSSGSAATAFDTFQHAQSRLSSSYSRNFKNN
ncbi:Phospholipid-transporting ATPase 2 [Acorus gramineus]|uniref:Phospholipid-transporting ATPase 2 n=1 Tax=Acorus gramineus TaxID=55184 RepID=A0AAV9A796_ACOGR|nr:Phospholipid-transporting ATPase 2 [Acorus gramineus]